MPGFNFGEGPKEIPLTPLLWVGFVLSTFMSAIFSRVNESELSWACGLTATVCLIAAAIRSTHHI